jgi:hypothetical protein
MMRLRMPHNMRAADPALINTIDRNRRLTSLMSSKGVLVVGCAMMLTAVASAGGQRGGTTEAPCPPGQSAPLFSEILTTEEAATRFLLALNNAVVADNRPLVASMVRYPISVGTKGRSLTLRTSRAFVASYDRIFTPALKKVIAEARAACLFTRSDGAVLHDGEIWLMTSPAGQLQIITINSPIGAVRKK